MVEQIKILKVIVIGGTKRIRAVVVVDLVLNIVSMVLTPFSLLREDLDAHEEGYDRNVVIYCIGYVILFGIILRVIMTFGLIPLWLSTSRGESLQRRIVCANIWTSLCLLYLIAGIISFLVLFALAIHWILLLDTLLLLLFRFAFLLMQRKYVEELNLANITHT